VTINNIANGAYTFTPPSKCLFDQDTSYTFLYSVTNGNGCIDTSEMIVFVLDEPCIEICGNGTDDDEDGYIDCEDPDCGVTTFDFDNGPNAFDVRGQSNFTNTTQGTSPSRFASSYGIVYDSISDKVFVSDGFNHRILRYGSAADFINNVDPEAVLGQIDFTANSSGTAIDKLSAPQGIFIDHTGTLWVSDGGNHRVVRFDNAATIVSGSNADGVLGQPNFTSNTAGLAQNLMDYPKQVWVDKDGTLWVAERFNNRVTRWDNAASKPDGANASIKVMEQMQIVY